MKIESELKMKIKHIACLLSLFSILSACHSFELKEGDLLFQDLDCGPMCDAIEAVTNGIDNYNFSHVALIVSHHDTLFALEAISAGVVLTPVADFLDRSLDTNGQPKVLVARLTEKYKSLNSDAVSYAKSRLGYPYDELFLTDNQAYYCSELLYEAYKHANNSNDFFSLMPMTFKSNESTGFFPVWKMYYNDLNAPIPEGKPGLNPGGMSTSDKIYIVHQYGQISKK